MNKLEVPISCMLVMYLCDECGKGEYKYSYNSKGSDYVHACNQCGHRVVLDQPYPRIRRQDGETP